MVRRLSVGLLLVWVLWRQTSPAGQVPPRAASPPTVWNAVQTFGTRPECEAGKRSTLDRWRAGDQEGYEVNQGAAAEVLTLPARVAVIPPLCTTWAATS